MGVGIEIFQRERGNLRKGVGTEISHHLIGDAVIQRAHDPLRRGGNRHRNPDFEKNRFQSGKIYIAFADDAIDRVADENRDIQR